MACEKLIQVSAGSERLGTLPTANELLTCLLCLQVLIGDEPEVGMDNLLEVQVPEDVERQLQQLDQQEQLELAQELRDKGAPRT